MKLIIKTVLILIVVGTGFISCKKGKHDPLLSLRSRGARMVGKWTLESVDGTTTQNFTSTSSGSTQISSIGNTVKYDGSVWTETVQNAQSDGFGSATSTTVTTVKTYTMELDIVKDGTCEIKETASIRSLSQSSTPSNTCIGSNTPLPNSTNDGLSCDGTYSYPVNTETKEQKGYWHWMDSRRKKLFVHIDNLGDFYIDQLRNKDLKLIQVNSVMETYSSVSASSTGPDETTSIIWTFKQ
jgi:hypothetical protein